MSIAFDSAISTRVTSSTSLTFAASHVLGSGSRRAVIVATDDDNFSDTVTGVTYNGVAMTQFPTVSPIGDNGSNHKMTLWYLLEASLPTAGTYTVTATRNSSTSADLYISAISYFDVLGSGFPDNSTNLAQASGSTSITTSLTTAHDNCWTLCVTRARGGSLSASTGSTQRGSIIGTAWGLFDSNGVIHPAGSTSMTQNGSSGQSITTIMISFTPGSVTPISVSDSFSGLTDAIIVLVGNVISVSDSFTGLIDSIKTKFGWGNQGKTNSQTWNNTPKT